MESVEAKKRFVKKMPRNADIMFRCIGYDLGNSTMLVEHPKSEFQMTLRVSEQSIERCAKFVSMYPDSPWFGHLIDERMAAAIPPWDRFVAEGCNATPDGVLVCSGITRLSSQDKEKSGTGIITLAGKDGRVSQIQAWHRFGVDTRSPRLKGVSEQFVKPNMGFQLRIVKSGNIRALSPCIESINGEKITPEGFLSECDRFSAHPRLKGKVEACVYQVFETSKFGDRFDLVPGRRESQMASCESFLLAKGEKQVGRNLAVQNGIWLLTPDDADADGSIYRKDFVQRVYLSGYLGNVHAYIAECDGKHPAIGRELSPFSRESWGP